MFVEIDRMCKYVYGELHERMTKALAKECLEHPPIVPFVFTRSCRTMGANSPMRCSRSIYDRRAPPTFSIRHGHNTGSNTGLQNSDTPGPWTGGSVQPHDKYPFRQAVPRRYRGPTQAPPHSVPSVYNFQRPLTSLEIPIPACHDSGHLSTSSRIVLVGSMQENCGLKLNTYPYLFHKEAFQTYLGSVKKYMVHVYISSSGHLWLIFSRETLTIVQRFLLFLSFRSTKSDLNLSVFMYHVFLYGLLWKIFLLSNKATPQPNANPIAQPTNTSVT